jgi:hypothetical protein
MPMRQRVKRVIEVFFVAVIVTAAVAMLWAYNQLDLLEPLSLLVILLLAAAATALLLITGYDTYRRVQAKAALRHLVQGLEPGDLRALRASIHVFFTV